MGNQRKIKVIKRTQQNLETNAPSEDQKPHRDSIKVIADWVRLFRERQRENDIKRFKELFG